MVFDSVRDLIILAINALLHSCKIDFLGVVSENSSLRLTFAVQFWDIIFIVEFYIVNLLAIYAPYYVRKGDRWVICRELKGHKHLIFRKKLNHDLAIVLSVNCLHQRETKWKVKYIAFIIFKNKFKYQKSYTTVHWHMERLAIFFMQFINNVKT